MNVNTVNTLLNVQKFGVEKKLNTPTTHAMQNNAHPAVSSFYDLGSTRFTGSMKANSVNALSFTGAESIDGVRYTKGALALGDQMLKPEEARALYQKSLDKVEQVKEWKETKEGYTNARAGTVGAATVLGDTGKTYTSCNVDFFSSRWGYTAGVVASSMAVNDLNNTIKAVAVSDMNLDRRSLNWLANTSNKYNHSRGGKNLQVVSMRPTSNGKQQLWVRTLGDIQGFMPKAMPQEETMPEAVKVQGKTYTPETPEINTIQYSDHAKTVMADLEAKGVDVGALVKKLGGEAQGLANSIEKEVYETDSVFNTAPASNYRFMSAVHGDNDKIYTAANVEYYDNGFLAEVVCSEKTAISKAVNDGAQKIDMIFITNNQDHNDTPCCECLGWMSTARGGNDLLVASYIRDDDGNKTDQAYVTTIKELFPAAHKPSPVID